MTDTLKDRAGKFRENCICPADAFDMDMLVIRVRDLLAEIKWARENPPFPKEEKRTYASQVRFDMARRSEIRGWQSFADHLLSCLEEK